MEMKIEGLEYHLNKVCIVYKFYPWKPLLIEPALPAYGYLPARSFLYIPTYLVLFFIGIDIISPLYLMSNKIPAVLKEIIY